ncbi:unnamed protein product [Nippostrongylus brasiliensis]|uniref:Secreted protein n=1 Tax=Nippostrongylus brasiliensis TaxID=27835 RepID=A0A0N4XD38_NIPBR|nr:unnamed protein product [Nippostrongylus brasiliensis]
MLIGTRAVFFLATLLLEAVAYPDSLTDSAPMRAKRYVSFNLLRPYVAAKEDPFERPIMLQTREARSKLDCILNLRSFELCRERL